jgi:D-alanyl-D-alanine dipeptidase
LPLGILLVSTGLSAAAEKGLVEVLPRIPDAVVDLRYATTDNFLHRAVYPPTARCLLRPEALDLLVKAAASLRAQGFRLRLYDCYRPNSVQWEMWKLFPHEGYVADPQKGSPHNRGAAVDLSLVTSEGSDVEMPTAFDTFSPAAHHGFDGASAAAKQHRERLHRAMLEAGFKENRMEWWHYQLPESGKFPVLDVPFPP